jgi:hypothetical protein
VAGGGDRRERADRVTVGENEVGVRAERGKRRPGALANDRRGLRVIAVAVGEQDRAGAAAGVQLGEERVDVLGQGGTGVDQVRRVATDDPAVGPGERVGAGVRGADEGDVVRAECQSSSPAGRSRRLRTVPRKSAASAP